MTCGSFGRINAAACIAGTTNATILALAKAFADRAAKDGVQVNTILPGSVMTDRRKTMLQGYADTRGLSLDAAIDQFAAEVSIARYGQPEDIIYAVAFCSRLTAPGSSVRRSASMAAKPRCSDR